MRTHLLLALTMLACVCQTASAAEAESEARPALESPSPDGLFAFRYTSNTEAEPKAYDLISQRAGKALVRVLESDVDPGPSARFHMDVLWKPDSKAFALTATLWKRGSYVEVYSRDGESFRKVKLPELLAEIPEREKKGKRFPHIVELNSQSATRWERDGTLVVEVENLQDGEGSLITAKRTVILGFGTSGTAKILKSNIKFTVETQ